MVEFEFSLEQNLRYEDAVESMFDLLDFFADSDSFDEVDWDAENDTAFVANDDMEVEFTLNEGSLDVFVAIHARDLSKHEIRSNLTEDIGRFFGTRRTRAAQSHRRNWREEGARPREIAESSDSGRSRRQGSGRFGRPQSGTGSAGELGNARESHRSARSSDNEPIESRTKARPQALPSRREEESAPAAEKLSASSAVSSTGSERKAPAPLKRAEGALEAKGVEKSEPKDTKKPPYGLSAKPATSAEAQPAEKKEGGGSWFWWILLLILIGGGIALYMSPLWPLGK